MLRESLYLLKRCLKNRSMSREEELAGKCINQNMSFRLDPSAEKDLFIGFREFIRAIFRMNQRVDAVHKINSPNKSNIAVLAGAFASEKNINEYIEKSTGFAPGYFISRDLLGGKLTNNYGALLSWVGFSLKLALQSVFFHDRKNRALLIREVTELAWLMEFLKANEIKHLYNFFPFEKDANLISLACKSLGIKVTLIPSSGPLWLHNHTMIADEIVFVVPYHYEEYRAGLNSTIICDKIIKWIPEKAYTYIDKYASGVFEEKKFVLGYYSHGSWLRSVKGNSHDGISLLKSEERVLNDLSRFLLEDSRFSLVIFPHPKERSTSMISETERYYSEKLPENQFTLFNTKKMTAEAFEEIDIAVAAYSSIVYERLFCGFKMIIGTEGIEGFPLKNSSLEKISYQGYESMKSMLLRYSELSKEEFFDQLGLTEYRYTSYPQWS
jgi:hypothetical protein